MTAGVEVKEKSGVWDDVTKACVCVVLMCACISVCVVFVNVNVRSADALCPHRHQVKVMTESELLGYACEQFLGKSVVEIKSVILQTLEGHLRAILGG